MTVTKEMCGLRGAAKTDFDSSVSRFTQQVTYISKLVGKTNDALYSMAIIGHLLVMTSPENLQAGKLTVSPEVWKVRSSRHDQTDFSGHLKTHRAM